MSLFKNNKAAEPQDKNTTILAYMHDVVYLLAGVLLLFLLLFRIVTVSGASMHDTLVDGDYVLLLNSVFCGEPEQGDIVVISKERFKDGEPIIKRVIATEGQTVTIKNGEVLVDGELLDEPYLSAGTYTKSNYPYSGFDEPIHITVEKGHVFCLGDNRDVSLDSRNSEVGQVDCREIIGKAIINFLPRGTDEQGYDFSRFGGIS